MKTLTAEEWKTKGTMLFGDDVDNWQFQCPICKQSQSLAEFKAAGVLSPRDKFYFSCIGRWVEGRGCDWTLGGLLRIHETEVIAEDGDVVPVLEFFE
jgi:hypothetical protein